MDGCSSVIDCLVCVSEFDGQHKKKKRKKGRKGGKKKEEASIEALC